MTPARARVLDTAKNGLVWVKSSLAEAAGVSPGVIDGLVDAGALVDRAAARLARHADGPVAPARQAHQGAGTKLRATLLDNTSDGFTVTLLDGVTGSGKTEIYFEAIAAALARGKQVLVLMPEIALTNQFITRCEERFGARPAEWHSGVSAPMRGRVWRAVAENKAKLVVGARSALFLPFPDLGLIVVDEEHDQSYKQEERVAYQARDMAVVRGHLGRAPVVLSSATPSIESLVNAEQGRYRHIRLGTRYKAAGLPAISAIDMRASPPERGRWLSPVLVEAVGETLGARRAGAAVPEPPRLCAGDALPQMRLQIRMPELLGLAGRAPVPAPARMPPLRHLRADPRDMPELRRRAFTGAVRARHRAHRRGGRRAVPGGAPRAAVERPHAVASAICARPCARSRTARSMSSSARSSWPRDTTFRGWRWSAWSTAISAWRRPTRARPSAPSSCSIR